MKCKSTYWNWWHLLFQINFITQKLSNITSEWQYSISEFLADFHDEYHEVVFEYNTSYNGLTYYLQLFRETGSVGPKTGSGGPSKRMYVYTVENIEAIQHIDENSKTSNSVML